MYDVSRTCNEEVYKKKGEELLSTEVAGASVLAQDSPVAIYPVSLSVPVLSGRDP
jgi:hypothetical protein